MESEKKSLSRTLVESALSLTVGVASLLVYAWCCTVMWGWFIVPAGLMALPYTAFVGAFFIVGMFNLYHASMTKQKMDDARETSWEFTFGWSILKIVMALLALGIAGIYHAFLF